MSNKENEFNYKLATFVKCPMFFHLWPSMSIRDALVQLAGEAFLCVCGTSIALAECFYRGQNIGGFRFAVENEYSSTRLRVITFELRFHQRKMGLKQEQIIRDVRNGLKSDF